MWLGGQKRPPGWLDAGTLASVIFGVMLAKKKAGLQIPPDLKFDAAALMKEFINAAGFPMENGHPDQPLWNELHEGKTQALRVGWFPWGGFATQKIEDFVGPSRNVCDRLCELLGFSIQPVRLEVHDLEDKLANREVHLLAPLIQLPARAFKYACSQPLPEVRVGLGLVVHKKVADSLPGNPGRTPYQELAKVPFDNLQICLVKEGVADAVLRSSSVPRQFGSFKEAWEAVREHPLDSESGQARAFMADAVSCKRIILDNPDFVQILADQHRLPVCFGVHPDETRLMTVVNLCLAIIEADGIKSLIPDPNRLGFTVPTDQKSELKKALTEALQETLPSFGLRPVSDKRSK